MVAMPTAAAGARLAPLLRPPAHAWSPPAVLPARRLERALASVRTAPTIVAALRAAPGVAEVARTLSGDRTPGDRLLLPLLDAIADPDDTVTAIAAIHALALVSDRRVDAGFHELLMEGAPGFEAHAAWALAGRAPTDLLVAPLVATVTRGGLAGMHAQTALGRWSRSEPGRTRVLDALAASLATVGGPGRRFLVETVGLVPGSRATHMLTAVATDVGESSAVRRTAIAAFAERADTRLPASIAPLATRSAEIGQAVRSVRVDRRLRARGPVDPGRDVAGLRIAQVHLGAELDAAVSRAGAGDTGGVATLLARLGTELAERPRIGQVITIGRRRPADRRDPDVGTESAALEPAHRFEGVELADGDATTFATGWPSRVAAERGIRRVLLANGSPDVIHLRMADPGSDAASRVATELGVPVVFTLAPDPHGPLDAAERSGTLDRRGFAAADGRAHLWYRAALVERLAASAAQVALFPRERLRDELRDLLAVDIRAGQPRYTIVPEGVDTRPIDRAVASLRREATPADGVPDRERPRLLDDLAHAARALPPARHGLPIVLSVGRLHEAKGMSRLVEAFARDARLADRANLVIVGGDLEAPSAAEAAELTRIHRLLETVPGLRDRVILLGHRPNDEVASAMVIARLGLDGIVGAGGVYACASLKEEFGLAIVEAMAAGLSVVAPTRGGPATYVEDGRTGYLVETLDPLAIARGTRAALDLAHDPATAIRARAVVDDRYTLARMASTLASVYRVAAASRHIAAPRRAVAPR